MNRAFLFLLIHFFCQQMLQAQERVFTSDTVKVNSNASSRKSEQKDDSLKSTPLTNRVGIYLRGASPASSSGISIRAAAPAHTDVSWNGIPVANPLLAQADASMIPGIMLQQAGIRDGGRTENGFSSGFGGSILLGNSNNQFPNLAEAGMSAGSFGQWEQWLQLSGEKAALSGKLRCWNSLGKWDYPVRFENFESRLQHNARQFYGAEGSGSVRFSKKHTLTAGFWVQRSNRQLPGALFEENPDSKQTDENHRMFARYSYRSGRFFSNPMLGLSQDLLHFSQRKAGIDSRAMSNGIFFRNESGMYFHQHRLCVQTHTSRQEGNAGMGSGSRQIWRSGIGLVPEFHSASNRLHFFPELRLEDWYYPETGRMDVALLPAGRLNFRGQHGHSMELGWHARKRNPGLNDLYWPNAGNPLLRGERGFTSNLDWHYQTGRESIWIFRQQAGVFFTRINDYILWIPEGQFWRPQNAGLGRIAGIQLRTSFQYHFAQAWIARGEADVQLSNQELHIVRENQSLRTGMPFQPARQASFFAAVENNSLSLFFRGMYNSSRSTGLLNSKEMPAYQLLDGGLRWQHTFSRITSSLFFHVNNIFNSSYNLLPANPMPGRNYQFGTSIKI